MTRANSKAVPAVGHAQTILVVEDHPDLRAAMETVFGRHGYRVLPAACGDDALRAVATHDIDFAVIDMMIPGPSGFKVLRAVKDRDGRPPVKAVMISANGAAAHQEYARVLGADSFLVKPFPLADLFRVVRELCPPPAPVFTGAADALPPQGRSVGDLRSGSTR